MQAGLSDRRCEFKDADCNWGGPHPDDCVDCPNRPQRCLVCGAKAPGWPYDLCRACRRRGDRETIYQYYVRSQHTTRWLQEVFKNKNAPYIISSRSHRLVADLDGWVEATFKRMTGRQQPLSLYKPLCLSRLQQDGLLPSVAHRSNLPPKDRKEAWRWLYIHSPPEVRQFLSNCNTSHLWATFKQRHRSP